MLCREHWQRSKPDYRADDSHSVRRQSGAQAAASNRTMRNGEQREDNAIKHAGSVGDESMCGVTRAADDVANVAPGC